MPQQEVFFEQEMGERRIEVLKTYDRNYAHEAFQHMDPAAQKFLCDSLAIAQTFGPEEIPSMDDPALADFLWEELLDASREDGNLLSFFVVNEVKGSVSNSIYVSADWPSAEVFARNQLALPPGIPKQDS